VVTAGPDGLLGIPSDASPLTDNPAGSLSLNAFIDKFYGPASVQSEKSLYVQRGFVSGGFEGWFSADNSSHGNALVDITARVGDYLVEVQDFTAATPDPTAAEALLLKQIQALTPHT